MLNSYTQTFKAEPIGLIHDGSLVLTFDTVTGSMKGWVKAHYGPFGVGSYSEHIDEKIEPSYLLSEQYKKVGTTLALGAFQGTVTAVGPSGEWITADVKFKNYVGRASFDTSGKWIRLHQLDAQGAVYKMNLHLVLTEV